MLRLSTYIYTLAISIAILHIKIYIKFTGQSWLNLEKYISDIYSSRFIKNRYRSNVTTIKYVIYYYWFDYSSFGQFVLVDCLYTGVSSAVLTCLQLEKTKVSQTCTLNFFFILMEFRLKISFIIYIFFLSFCENNNRKFHLNSVFVLKKRRKERKEERNE